MCTTYEIMNECSKRTTAEKNSERTNERFAKQVEQWSTDFKVGSMKKENTRTQRGGGKMEEMDGKITATLIASRDQQTHKM